MAKGLYLGKLGKYEKAIDAYNKAIEIDPQNSEAWYRKCFVLAKLGNHDEAVDAFYKAIEINPKYLEEFNAYKRTLNQSNHSLV